MDTISSTIAAPASAAERQEPSKKQFVGNRGRTPSPPLKNRVLVFNCRENTIEVENKKDFVKRPGAYKEIKLPPLRSEVTIFVDSQTESTPTMDNATKNGHSNIMLAKIYLNRLGAFNKLLRVTGQLQTLYITNIKPWSETSSPVSDLHGGTV